MLLILSGCIRFTVTNPSGEVDAEITIKPTAEAIENTVMTQELDRSVEVGISIPISKSSNQ